MPRKKKIKYRAQTDTGKTYVADTFLEALAGIGETLQINQPDLRILLRSTDSWYIYRSETDMIRDLSSNQRTQWCARVDVEG